MGGNPILCQVVAVLDLKLKKILYTVNTNSEVHGPFDLFELGRT